MHTNKIIKSEIELFVEKNFEKLYYEKADDLFIMKPICGLLAKWVKYKGKMDNEKNNEIESLKCKMAGLIATIEYKDTKIREMNREIERLKEMINGNFKMNGSKLTNIKNAVNDYFNVDIGIKRRFKDIVYARQIAMYFARILTNESEEKIGFEFAGLDHSMVYHAVKKIKELLIYSRTQNDIKELTNIIKSTI